MLAVIALLVAGGVVMSWLVLSGALLEYWTG